MEHSIADPEVLSTWTTFLWGGGGAMLSLLAFEGLPLARMAAVGELAWRPDPLRIAGVTFVGVIFLLLGGGAAILVGGATEPKHAIFYGLGWQGILSGYMRAAKSAAPPAT